VYGHTHSFSKSKFNDKKVLLLVMFVKKLLKCPVVLHTKKEMLQKMVLREIFLFGQHEYKFTLLLY